MTICHIVRGLFPSSSIHCTSSVNCRKIEKKPQSIHLLLRVFITHISRLACICQKLVHILAFFQCFFFLLLLSDKIKLMRWFSNYERAISYETEYTHAATQTESKAKERKKKNVKSHREMDEKEKKTNETRKNFTWHVETKAYNIVDTMWTHREMRFTVIVLCEIFQLPV